MDPLADFTALSPGDVHRFSRDGASQSQQCSADPNAFLGLRLPDTVVVSGSRTAASGSMRLALDVNGGTTASQMSQVNEVFMDTQYSDTEENESDSNTAASRQPKAQEPVAATATNEVETKEPRVKSGFLSRLELRLEGATEEVPDNDEIMSVESSEDESEQEEVGGEQADATESLHYSAEAPIEDEPNNDWQHEAVVAAIHEADEGYGTEDEEDAMMDSYPATQLLDGYVDEESDDGGEGEVEYGSTEVWTETTKETDNEVEDVDMHATDGDRHDHPDYKKQSQEAEEQSASGAVNTEDQTLAELAERMKQERKQVIDQNASVVRIDTEDQTLAELTARMQAEREEKILNSSITEPSAATSRTTRALVFTSQSQESESQEDLPPTQPTKPEVLALRKRGKSAQPIPADLSTSQEQMYEFVESQPRCQCGAKPCQCSTTSTSGNTTTPAPGPARPPSASRNLEFAFAVPQSQDSESQLPDSAPDLGALALKTIQATKSPVVEKLTSASISESSKPPIPQRASTTSDTSVLEMTPTKRRRQTSTDSPQAIFQTPSSTRKRGRTFLSPDAGASVVSRLAGSADSSTDSRETTPVKSARISKVAAAATPSVRTRAKHISPVPSVTSRTYSSRSRSMFRNKVEFCLTGFLGEGEENLIKLIEDYGGRIHDKITDLLDENASTHAVVIATPVSWRKLKFMYAVAAGIPVVHPEWIHACASQGSLVAFDGYYVPGGYSITTTKFECNPMAALTIFKGIRFGIPHDVQPTDLASSNPMNDLIAYALRSCGAYAVDSDLLPSREKTVDVVVADEYTKICDHYARKHQTPIKSFTWVMECIILQRMLPLDADDFKPPSPSLSDNKHGVVTVDSAVAQIGDSKKAGSGTTLKLSTGELVLVDLANNDIDHFLLFDVCEIVSIKLISDRGKRKQDTGASQKRIELQLGVLERYPNSPALHRRHIRVVDLPPEKVKRRVVAVAKTDFDAMLYRDESIFYYEE